MASSRCSDIASGWGVVLALLVIARVWVRGIGRKRERYCGLGRVRSVRGARGRRDIFFFFGGVDGRAVE